MGGRIVGIALRGVDGLAEGYGPLHHDGVLLSGHAVVTLDAFGEAVDTADNLCGIVKMKFAQFILIGGEVVVVLDVRANFLRDIFFTDRQHQNLVVRQQSLADSIVEGQPVELLAIQFFGVHRAEDVHIVVLLCLYLHVGTIETWCSCHIQAVTGTDKVVVMNLREVAFCLVFQDHTCCAVSLITDNQVYITTIEVEGFLHHIDTLISGEDDRATLLLGILLELAKDGLRVSSGRHSQVYDTGILIVGIHHLARGFGIGTDADSPHLVLLISHPGIERLAQQGDARHEKQHEGILLRQLLHHLQRGIGLTRSASHNQLAALVTLFNEVFVCL